MKSKKPSMVIFGESHFVKQDVDKISKSIERYRPDVLLHELLDNKLYNKQIADKLIKEGNTESENGVEIIDILELISKLNCKAYGIDRTDEKTDRHKVGLAKSFIVREEAMLKNIKKYRGNKTVVVVGDTHLRIKDEKQLGGVSLLYNTFKDDESVLIIRSKYREIDKELKLQTDFKLTENTDLILESNSSEEIKNVDPIVLLKNLRNYSKVDRNFLNLFMERIVDDKHIKPKYKFTDEITLEKDQASIFKISKTKIGRLIFNAFCLPKVYIEEYGFIDSQVDGKVYDTIHENLSLLLLNKKITHEEYADVIDRLTWLGMTLTNFKGHCMDYDSITMSDNFIKHKTAVYDDLIKTNASPEEVLKAEADLIEMAKKEKSNTGLYKIIKSGSKGNFDNNFKNLTVGRGLIQMPDGKPKVLTRSLAEGNKLSDYVYLSNNSIQGSFGRSLKTAQGGNIQPPVYRNVS